MFKILSLFALVALASASVPIPFEQLGYCGGAAQIYEVRADAYQTGRGISSMSPGQSINVEIDFAPLMTSTLIDLDVSAVFADGSTNLLAKRITGHFAAYEEYRLHFTYNPSEPMGDFKLRTQMVVWDQGIEIVELCREFRVEVFPGQFRG